MLKKGHRHYEHEQLVFFSLLFSISPHAYRFIRNSGNLILPHPTTIRKITSNFPLNPSNEQASFNFLKYVEERYKYVKEHEKNVVLMLDEIHLKPYFDYKGGDIVGFAFDSEQAATSAHTFMISSLCSNYKDVAHILPVKSITADILFSIIKKTIIGLENIGYKVIAIVTDNNAINGKAMSYFSDPPKMQIAYPHPVNPQRLLFYIIDAVHIFKCIRNNWLNQRNDGCCIFYPNFQDSHCINKLETASFNTLRKLYELEHAQLVKYGYGLTLKALNPTNIERQNVQLVVRIFNEFIVKALLEFGEKQSLNYYQGTAAFIEIILRWWWVENVKSSDKGIRLKNVYMYPLTSLPKDERRCFLKQFIDWLDV
nr:uncharacterized protein LOC122272950 [Parasteatoda tepidariorum]